MVQQLARKHVSIRLAHILFVILIACGAFGAGMLLRPWGGSAAPGGDISACVNKYTGAVRMSPNGATTCNANESTVAWPAIDTDTVGLHNHYLAHGSYHVPGSLHRNELLRCLRSWRYCDWRWI